MPVSLTGAWQQEEAARVAGAAQRRRASGGACQGPAVRDLHGAYEGHVLWPLWVSFPVS